MAEYRIRNKTEMEGASRRHSDCDDRFASGRCLRQIPDSYTQPSNCRDANLHNHFNQTVEFTIHLRLLSGESRYLVRQDFPDGRVSAPSVLFAPSLVNEALR